MLHHKGIARNRRMEVLFFCRRPDRFVVRQTRLLQPHLRIILLQGDFLFFALSKAVKLSLYWFCCITTEKAETHTASSRRKFNLFIAIQTFFSVIVPVSDRQSAPPHAKPHFSPSDWRQFPPHPALMPCPRFSGAARANPLP